MDKKNIRKIMAASLCFAAFLHYENKGIMKTEYTIKSKDISSDFDGFSILQVSDLQSNRFGKSQVDLITAAYEMDPDIIVITGDLIDRNHTDYNLAYEAVAGLSQIAPVFYVNGNHELLLDSREYEEFLQKIKTKAYILIGDAVVINSMEKEREKCDDNNLILAGLDEEVVFDSRDWDRKNKDYDKEMITEAVKALYGEKEGYRILLAHEPQLVEEYEKANPNLIISGHAHGGQIRLPIVGGLYSPEQGIFPRFTCGVHSIGDSQMVVSRGLGNSRFPFRIFNRPEIVKITLKSE